MSVEVIDTRIFARNGEFVLSAVGDEGVLMPLRDRVADLDSVYVMSPVALRIWSLIDGATPVGTIAAHIEEEYDVTSGAAARDVAALLDALAAAELVRLN